MSILNTFRDCWFRKQKTLCCRRRRSAVTILLMCTRPIEDRRVTGGDEIWLIRIVQSIKFFDIDNWLISNSDFYCNWFHFSSASLWMRNNVCSELMIRQRKESLVWSWSQGSIFYDKRFALALLSDTVFNNALHASFNYTLLCLLYSHPGVPPLQRCHVCLLLLLNRLREIRRCCEC